MKLSNRVSQLKPSPTLELVAKAKALQAEGHDVISMSVGEPDWDTFPAATEAGVQAIQNGQTRYTPGAGTKELRQAIAEQTSRDLGVDYQFQQVSVTSGAKFILSGAIQCLVNPGDEVIVPEPYWVSYPAMVDLAGGQSVFVKTNKENDFKLTADSLSSAINEKSRVLFLNSPSNPSGKCYSREELTSLASVIRENPEIVVLSDDIYNRLMFTGSLAPHILRVAPDLADRVICINGVSKSYAMTGWRIGWAVGPQGFISALASYQSQALGCASSISQAAALVAIESSESDIKKALEVLVSRRDQALKGFEELPGIEALSPDGAFYVWASIDGVIGKSYKGEKITDSRDFCRMLLENHHVVVVPGQEFGIDGYFRMSFALDSERMLAALGRMSEFLSALN